MMITMTAVSFLPDSVPWSGLMKIIISFAIERKGGGSEMRLENWYKKVDSKSVCVCL